MRPILALTAAALLAACVPATAPQSGTPVAAVAAGTATPVSGARAVALFDAVCGGSLPNFASATAKMASNGIAAPSPLGTPTVYSATEDVSFQIQDGPGLGKTCSMVFGSPQREAAVLAALTAIGPFKRTAMGTATVYRGGSALVLFSGETQKSGTTSYYNIRMLSAR
jgi:hypothetical protein